MVVVQLRQQRCIYAVCLCNKGREKPESQLVMNGPDSQIQESNGISPLHSSQTSASSSEKYVSVDEGGSEQEFADPPVIQIEVSCLIGACTTWDTCILQRDLDELTYSGTAINDLEIQLTRTKKFYQQVLVDGKLHVDMLRKKLHSHIVKSEPFIEVWRKARQVGEQTQLVYSALQVGCPLNYGATTI